MSLEPWQIFQKMSSLVLHGLCKAHMIHVYLHLQPSLFLWRTHIYVTVCKPGKLCIIQATFSLILIFFFGIYFSLFAYSSQSPHFWNCISSSILVCNYITYWSWNAEQVHFCCVPGIFSVITFGHSLTWPQWCKVFYLQKQEVLCQNNRGWRYWKTSQHSSTVSSCELISVVINVFFV